MKTEFFKIAQNGVEFIEPGVQPLEMDIQKIFEKSLWNLLGIHYLGTEYGAGDSGRIDTIGIDEQNHPVVIEYKRKDDKNAVAQIARYGDWLEIDENMYRYGVMVTEKIGKDAALAARGRKVRLICIASKFYKSDLRVAERDDRVELIEYSILDGSILMLKQVAGDSGLGGARRRQSRKSPVGSWDRVQHARVSGDDKKVPKKRFREQLDRASPAVRERFNRLYEFMTKGLADVVAGDYEKIYLNFKCGERSVFASVYIQTKGAIKISTHVNPDWIGLEKGFTRDMRGVGHLGNGDLGITVRSDGDLEKAKPLLERAYRNLDQGAQVVPAQSSGLSGDRDRTERNFQKRLDSTSPKVRRRVNELSAFIEGLGDDVRVNKNEKLRYRSFKRVGQFVFAYLILSKEKIRLHVGLNPDKVGLEEGFTRDLRDPRGRGHWGRCDLQIDVRDDEELEKAKPLLERAYRNLTPGKNSEE